MGLLDNINLDDPKTMGLLNLGLGILAGNTGRPGDLGQGIMQGFGNYQQMQAQQQRQKMLDKQFSMDQELFGLKKAEAERDAKKPLVVGKSLVDPVTYQPVYQATGAASGVDPYYTPIPTEQGLGSFDNRSGKFQIIAGTDGRPVIKSTDSPLVRGAVKDAEAQATAGWKPNTDIDGLLATDAQVAAAARGLPTNNFSTPYPVTFGAPGTTATDVREGTTGDIPMRSPYNQRPGIRIPTKAELAGAETTAKESAKTAVELGAERNKAVRKSDQLLNAARQAETLLGQNPTGSGIGAAADMAGRAIGQSTKGGRVASQLETLSGWMVANVPRMEGPQSNFDVQNYQTMAGKIGDRTIPVAERKEALKTLIQLQEKYKALNQDQPTQQRSREDILKQYGVRK